MKLLFAIALSFPTFCGFAADAPRPEEKEKDAIVGLWKWSVHNYLIDIRSDGTTKGPREVGTGVWEVIPTTTVERQYRLTWQGRDGPLDTITLSPDGKKLKGKALDGFEFTAERIEPTDAAREFDRLSTARDKALATADESINRLYQTALETLQRRATLANDLDTAVRIKQSLDKLSTKFEIVGIWNFVNHVDGVKSVVEFKANNTFFWNGDYVGAWETNEKQLIMTHDNRGGHQDYYNLPVRNGRLDGINTPRHKITLTRKAE